MRRGALGIEDDIFRVHTQVSGIIPAAETLAPLAPPQIQQLLERRYSHLQIPGREFTPPKRRQDTDPEFRVTDAANILGVSQPAASQLVERLLREQVIHRTRTQGRSVYYRPIGSARVALGISPDALSSGETG